MPSESEIIARLRKLARVNDRVLIGIGDDAAVIKESAAHDLIACCDCLVEGIHFRRDWTPALLLGRKALAVNLSDVAAMGGVPKFAMISIALPDWCSAEFVHELFDGMFELANASGVSVIGGDTSGSRDSLFIDVSVIGECERGKAITRRGARAGDNIYVSGSLGASAVGLSLLESGFRLDELQPADDPRRSAVLKLLSPTPQLALGRAIGEAGLATAMIDISDGLSTDLWHILDESQVGAAINAGAIPFAESVKSAGVGLPGIDPLSLVLNGGEDYELLFTGNPENHDRVVALAETLGTTITVIGNVIAEKRFSLERNGTIESVKPLGYQHLI